MWFKPNKHLVLISALLGSLVGIVACSQDRADNLDYHAKVSQEAAEPEEIRLEILLKDEQDSQAAPVTKSASPVSTNYQPQGGVNLPANTAGNVGGGYYGGAGYAGVAGGLDVPGAIGAGPVGLGPVGLGPVGLGPVAPGALVPGVFPWFGPGFDGPWFGPGYPFLVEDFLVVDDDNHGRRRHHEDDNTNDDDQSDDDQTDDDNVAIAK
jgi:hypothetical protein